jgi:hypothetical protein
MLRWLDSGKENNPEGLFSAKDIRHQIIAILKNPVNLEKVRAIAASRTASIWKIKRAKIILLTMEGRNIARVVLDVRVPPESILKCQAGFARLGLKYLDHPSRKPTQREAAVERMLSFLEDPPPERSVLWKRTSLRYIGHDFSGEGIRRIRDMIRTNPHWSQNQITRAVCELFDLRKSDGKFKHSQIGQALIRMAMDNLITLPASLRAKEISPKAAKNGALKNAALKVRKRPLTNPADIETIQFIPALNGNDLSLWRKMIEEFHYIDTSKLFGAQMRYLVYGGKNIEPTLGLLKNCFRKSAKNSNWRDIYGMVKRGDHLLGVIGFASSAWKLASRDRFIGWDDEKRIANLKLVVNNARFLILPWIKIPNLASRILGGVVKQLSVDWESRYFYRPVLLETFVQTDRFRGTCYRAANWIHVGRTCGYSLYSKCKAKSPPKDIYVYPLCRDFWSRLGGKARSSLGLVTCINK